MSKNLFKGIAIVLGALFLYGCAATENVEVRRYIEVKDRLDQDMNEGNAGYIMGTPQPEDRADIRKTRKIYVVEVSKGEQEAETVVVENANDVSDETQTLGEDLEYQSEDELDTLDLEDYDDDGAAVETKNVLKAPVATSSSAVKEYTIQKDDTLQKISKKFYDSYSKWSKIYEYNKDVIPDPDRIKPGTVIKIPNL
ncbi:MAG TPA: LysM peptidoglycan-binding domain-containing protein [Candidatus Omnitrophota bacterium]|nr:LysM peptidoglycan-binding domain-containing protein [Candidatus Omnitrophota bacterium]